MEKTNQNLPSNQNNQNNQNLQNIQNKKNYFDIPSLRNQNHEDDLNLNLNLNLNPSEIVGQGKKNVNKNEISVGAPQMILQQTPNVINRNLNLNLMSSLIEDPLKSYTIETTKETKEISDENMIVDLNSPYSIGPLLERCCSGDCRICKDNAFSKEFVVHSFDKNHEMDFPKLRAYLKANINKENHINRIISFKETNSAFLIQAQMVKGINLLKNLSNSDFTENEVADFALTFINIVQQSNLEFIPQIKMENIYFERVDKSNSIKWYLYDFGHFLIDKFSSHFENTYSDIIYYSPSFAANKNRTIESDIWRIGIIIYILLVGKTPFEILSGSQLIKFLKITKFDDKLFWDPNWAIFSDITKEFLSLIFTKNFKVSELLSHKFFLNDKTNKFLKSSNYQKVYDSIHSDKCKLMSLILLQNWMLNYIDYNVILSFKIDKTRTEFEKIDYEEEGYIDFEACKKILSEKFDKMALNEEEINSIVENHIEKNIEFTELLSKMININMSYFESCFEEYFCGLNTDNAKTASKYLILKLFDVKSKIYPSILIQLSKNVQSWANSIDCTELFHAFLFNCKAKSTKINL